MHPLEGPRLKLAAASAQITAFAEDNRTKSALPDDAIHQVFNRHTRECVYTAARDVPSDPVWSVRIGEIAHNLRSALDNIAWSVALLSTPNPHHGTGFPICTLATHPGDPPPLHGRSQRCFDRSAPKQLRDVDLRHHALFEAAQPYKSGQDVDLDDLYLLSCINNWDKHRLIHIVTHSVHEAHVEVRNASLEEFPPPDENGRPFVAGAELLRFRISRVAPDVRVAVRFHVLPVFGQACVPVADLPVHFALASIRDRVQKIFGTFLPLFPPLPTAPGA